MFFFFFFFKDNQVKVSMEIEFEGPKNEPLKLEEFNQFLTTISNLHNQIILFAQNDDLEVLKHSNFTNNMVLKNNLLEIKHICRKNPYTLLIEFLIDKNHVISYFEYWSLLINICEKYGSSTDSLLTNVENFEDQISKIHDNLLSFLKIEKKSLKNSDEFLRSFKIFINQKRVRKFYNFFCKTSITVNKFMSIVSGFGLQNSIKADSDPIDLLK